MDDFWYCENCNHTNRAHQLECEQCGWNPAGEEQIAAPPPAPLTPEQRHIQRGWRYLVVAALTSCLCPLVSFWCVAFAYAAARAARVENPTSKPAQVLKLCATIPVMLIVLFWCSALLFGLHARGYFR